MIEVTTWESRSESLARNAGEADGQSEATILHDMLRRNAARMERRQHRSMRRLPVSEPTLYNTEYVPRKAGGR